MKNWIKNRLFLVAVGIIFCCSLWSWYLWMI